MSYRTHFTFCFFLPSLQQLTVPNLEYSAHPFSEVRIQLHNQKSNYLRCVVVDAANKARNVSTFVRTNDQPLGRICCQKECHNTVAIIICPVLQIINIPSIFRDEGHILNISINLHSETEISVLLLCIENATKNVCAPYSSLFFFSHTICGCHRNLCAWC